MLVPLGLLFIAVPLAELAVIVRVSGALGLGDTLGLLVLVSIVGAWLVRRSGLGVLRQLTERTARGEVPGREILDGVLVLTAGALLLTPGFLTDAVGLALLVPGVRSLVRRAAMGWLRRRLAVSAVVADATGRVRTVVDGTVVDGTVVDGTVVDGTVVDGTARLGGPRGMGPGGGGAQPGDGPGRRGGGAGT